MSSSPALEESADLATAAATDGASPPRDAVGHALLISGRPMIWTAFRSEAVGEAVALANLLRWCLEIPGVEVGVDPRGLSQIVRSVAEQGAGQPLSPEDDEMLTLAGGSAGAAVVWPSDGEYFGPHWDAMLAGLRLSSGAQGYWWPGNDDRDWWFGATAESLVQFADAIDRASDETEILPFLARHEFTLFGALHNDALLQEMGLLFAAAREPASANALRQLQRFQAFIERHRDSGAHYWSWQLLAGSGVRASAVNTPVLTIWNYWPLSRHFAPEPWPGARTTSPPASMAEAAVFLQGAWEDVEEAFTWARFLHGVSLSEPEVGRTRCLSPVFFFASPVAPPAQPEDYLTRGGLPIQPLVTTSLQTDDVRSQEIASGVLEGDLLTLRRELASSSRYVPRYLIMPTASAAFPTHETEDDLHRIAKTLIYIEYDTSVAARDMLMDSESLDDRQSIWSGTIGDLSALIDEGLNLMQSVATSEVQRINERCNALSLAMVRMQARFARTNSGVNHLLRTFDSEIASSEDYLRRSLTTTSVREIGTQELLPALLTAYPYQRVKRALTSTRQQTDGLVDGIERIGTLVSAALHESDRIGRVRTARWSAMVTGLLPFLALVIALPGLMPQAQLTERNYPTWLGGSAGLATVATVSRFMTMVMLVVTVVALLFYLASRLHSRPRAQDPFVAKVQKFNALVANAESSAIAARAQEAQNGDMSGWSQVERIDQDAATLLVALWDDVFQSKERLFVLRRLYRKLLISNVERAQVDTWVANADNHRNGVLFFDLAPESIPLPRCLCIFRYKSKERLSRGMVSDWLFESSLLKAGIPFDEARVLDTWLTRRENRARTEEMRVSDFNAFLQSKGVSADPQVRDTTLWTGVIAAS